MAEYIEKDRLVIWMNDWMLQNAPVKAVDDTARADTILDAIRMVEDSPAANVRENVHGEWTSPDGISICSNCGKAAPYDVEGDIIMYWPNLNFCPNCGADMKGAEDG